MRNPYTLQKFMSPPLPRLMLNRKALIALLLDVVIGTQETPSRYKFVLLHAPAGYGKTTALVELTHYTSHLCCWYFLDQTDTDAIAFLQMLLKSVQYQVPQFGLNLASLLTVDTIVETEKIDIVTRGQIFLNALITTIKHEIPEPLIIFLCNYQKVNQSKTVNSLMSYFLQNIPERCTIVIESRAIPEVKIASLLAKREMYGIGIKALRFSTEEIQELAILQGITSFKREEAEKLKNAFDGWVTGILLGTRLADFQFPEEYGDMLPDPNMMLGVQIHQKNILHYVINEVFKDDQDRYTFLKYSAILQQMTPDLCNQLLAITNSLDQLQHLERQGLFVYQLEDSSPATYVCHPILREVLCSEFRLQAPEEFLALHRRAGEIFEAANIYEQAIAHAIEGQAYEQIAWLILKIYKQVLTQGRAETLAQWIDMLPPVIMTSHLKLLLMRASLYLLTGEQKQALSLLEIANTMIRQQQSTMEPEEILLMQAELDILQSKIYFQTGNYVQAQGICLHILQQLPVDQVDLRTEAFIRLGVCSNVLGDFTSGITYLQKAIHIGGQSSTVLQLSEIHGALASAYSLTGNFPLAEHHLMRAITLVDQGHDERGRVNHLNRIGLLKKRQGIFPEAEQYFLEALSIVRGPLQFRRGEAYTLVNLGELYQDQEQYRQSLTFLEDGLAISRAIKDTYLTNCTLCILAMTYLLIGDPSTAHFFVSETNIPIAINDVITYEQAIRDLVMGTILLHQHLYEQAYVCLTTLEDALESVGLRREALQLTVRIAACQLGRSQFDDIFQRFQKLASLIRTQDVDHLILLELHRYPALENFVKMRLETEGLRKAFNLEAEPSASPLLEDFVSPDLLTIQLQAPSLKIVAFGEPAVYLSDVSITRWRMARAMELFFFLLNHNKPIHKEQIIDALWAEVDERTSHTFHSTIYYLRKAIGETCLLSQKNIYTLDLTTKYGKAFSYDVVIVQEAQKTARAALKEDNFRLAWEAYSTIIDLYRGDYVQSFYSNWCTLPRDHFRQIYLDARRNLAQLAEQQELFNESIIHWQHMLEIDNCLEGAHLGLMRCYLRLGKKSMAIRQYQQCLDLLAQELGVQPGSKIQRFYSRLINAAPFK